MIILPTPSLHQFIMNIAPPAIIAPHGMTDLIHANKYKLLDQLYRINAATIAGIFACHFFHQDDFINALFLGSSIIHFRNDMPAFGTAGCTKNAIKFTCSSMLVATASIMSWNLFMYYMIFIHVPNHYRMNYKHIKHALPETIIAIGGLASILTAVDYSPINNPYLDWITKSLIIAHVVYEEVHIFKTVKFRL